MGVNVFVFLLKENWKNTNENGKESEVFFFSLVIESEVFEGIIKRMSSGQICLVVLVNISQLLGLPYFSS